MNQSGSNEQGGTGGVSVWCVMHGLRMLVAIVLSTWIGLAVTAGMLHWLLPAQTDTDSEAAP